jgi:hypothetical protein
MSATVTDVLTLLERVLWVVDNARMPARPHVADDGTVTPDREAGEGPLVVDAVEAAIRPDRRGVRRVGLTPRLWLTLLIMSAWVGQTTIANMYKIATGLLPRETQWELGVLTRDRKSGQVRMLTEKQLYTFAENINRFLDTDPSFGLDADKIAGREQLLAGICDALVYATHVLPRIGTSYAVDESGVWAWVKAARKAPKDLPLSDPHDEDQLDAVDPAALLTVGVTPARESRNAATDDEQPEQDLPDLAEQPLADEDADPDGDGSEGAVADEPGEDQPDRRQSAKARRAPRWCWFARWGVKTHKNGGRSSYYGYALHALLRIPDVIKGGGKGARTDRHAEPRLIEQFALTSASTDIVDVTLGMIKTTIGRGQPVHDLAGDRHYSYKQFNRWASKLWQLNVRQVLDLRQNEVGPVDYDGAIILAGTPHCGVPEHLWRLERPAKGADREDMDRFREQIAEREKYAMYRNKTPWGNGDGKTRWRSPVCNGTAGCEHAAGSVEIAIANGLPVLDPESHDAKWCTKDTVTLPAGPHMKHHQEEYWGSPDWEISWNRRTYVEGVFGNMKNHHTGNIRRGFMCLTGRALVSIAVAASVVAYNLREWENWNERAGVHYAEHPGEPRSPLLDPYAAHPLHQATKHIYGHTMLTAESQPNSMRATPNPRPAPTWRDWVWPIPMSSRTQHERRFRSATSDRSAIIGQREQAATGGALGRIADVGRAWRPRRRARRRATRKYV